MRIDRQGERFTLYKEEAAIGTAVVQQGHFAVFCIDPAWRGRGYGSYLLKEVLRALGGLDPAVESRFTAPLPADAAAAALADKYGFAVQGSLLCRRRVPELTAVCFCHDYLRSHLAPGGFYLDATCGNGHDTLFLCELAGPQGRVLGLDIQPRAVQATNARLQQAGYGAVGSALCLDHAQLAQVAPPGSADCVLFNFGWLPGADHSVHSVPGQSLPAVQAALAALKPGGILAAVLYSGKVIGTAERDAVLALLRSLPLQQYTVLECRFANWADTAPLPCFVHKKIVG